jgi:hypothetical protein
LECGVFCVEPLALAAGFEAVFRHGSLNCYESAVETAAIQAKSACAD